MSVITVVLYRDDHEESCRGCTVSRTDSWFNMESTADPIEAVQFLGRELGDDLLQRDKYPREYAPLDVMILIDGRQAWTNSDWDLSAVGDSKAVDLATWVYKSANLIAKDRLELHKERMKAEEEERQRRRAEEVRKADLAKLRELQSKYGVEGE